MCDVSDLFYTSEEKNNPIEGYLGDEAKEDCKILFVLREPNDTDTQKGFWFKDVLEGNASGGTKYKNVLGRIANKLINHSFDTLDDYTSVLKRCAYINISPFKGSNTETDYCKRVINTLRDANPDFGEGIHHKNSNIEKPKIEQIANNRRRIIKDIKCKYIVTVHDVFKSLMPKDATVKKGIIYKEKPQGAYWLDGKLIVNFKHPCCWISYEKLVEASFDDWIDT